VIVNAGALVDYISALTEFALLEGYGIVHDDVVSSSLRMLGDCGKWLIEQAVSFNPLDVHEDAPMSPVVEDGPKISKDSTTLAARQLASPYMKGGMISEDHFFLKWFPLLSAMGRIITETTDISSQTLATEILFETLCSAAPYFEVGYWKKIHRSVILPLFEDSYQSETTTPTAVWPIALQHLVDLLGILLPHLSSPGGVELIHTILVDLVVSMLGKGDEKLSMVGQVCLQQFLQKNISQFAAFEDRISLDNGGGSIWEVVTVAVERACRATIPAELLNCTVPATEVGDGSSSLLDDILIREADSNLARAIVNGRKASSLALSQNTEEKEITPVTDLSLLDFDYTIIKCGSHLELMEGLF
jgi:brefeldin A-inhibited guanine nucleotide-exchange protein